MSEIDPENDGIVENPAPEEDSDFVHMDGGRDRCLVTDQPEDDFCSEGDQQLTLQIVDQPSASGPLPGAAYGPLGSSDGGIVDIGEHNVADQDDGAGACGLDDRGSDEEKEENVEGEHRWEQEGAIKVESPVLEQGQRQNDLNDQPEDDYSNAVSGSASDRTEDGWSATADLPEDELAAGIPEDSVHERKQVSAVNPQDCTQPAFSVPSQEYAADLQELAADDAYSKLNQALVQVSDADGEDIEEGIPNNEADSSCDKIESSVGADVGHAAESETCENVNDSAGFSTEFADVASDSRKNVCQAPECDQSFQGSDQESPAVQNNHEGSLESSAGFSGSGSQGSNVSLGAEYNNTEIDCNLLEAENLSAAEVDSSEKFQGVESSSDNEVMLSASEPRPDSTSTSANGEFPSTPLGLCNSRESAGISNSPGADDRSGDLVVAEAASVTEADLASALSALSSSSSENSTPNPASSPVKSTTFSSQQPSTPIQLPPRPPPPLAVRPQASSSATSLQQSSNSASQESLSSSTVNSNFEDDLLSELDAELGMPEGRSKQGDARSPPGGLVLNGLKQADLASIPGLAELQKQLAAARHQLQEKDQELQR